MINRDADSNDNISCIDAQYGIALPHTEVITAEAECNIWQAFTCVWRVRRLLNFHHINLYAFSAWFGMERRT